MRRLIEIFRGLLKTTPERFTRSIAETINWNSRLICIKGARGTGKTTLLLQHIKKNFKPDETVLYVSLDDLWFTANTLTDLAYDFSKNGGLYLFLDEVHKYKGWSDEIKSIYDSYPDLNIVFTGSSLLELNVANGDLIRRADTYRLQGLSFREYLHYEVNKEFPQYSLEQITTDPGLISGPVAAIKPLRHFKKYLRTGYYPYFKETDDLYFSRVADTVKFIIENELPALRGVDFNQTHKLLKIMLFIANAAPFEPNTSEIERLTGADRNTVVRYIKCLAEADLLKTLYTEAYGIAPLTKPVRVFAENTNIIHSLPGRKPEDQAYRETFLVNQLSYGRILATDNTGAIITEEGKRFFAIDMNEVKDTGNEASSTVTWLATDGIEYGSGHTIPLWMFGFLY